ncbi:DUF6980 family protein [Methylobrevis albus]|uniref:DUF6980 domain-containing protein n=1 Tax=Methylobrevis albus TaxID=2793297 RepID=A0A931HZZ7_9HYPH|nr:hypothetical protein [Methylobrevis albus]MBH0237222.1 hypothetical protein [Methylobrevis albus]
MSIRLNRERKVLFMDEAGAATAAGNPAHCCQTMTDALTNDCEIHADEPFECADMLFSYSDKFDEYGLIVHDGGSAVILIDFCPFCGTRLPSSRRDDWFDEVEALGFSDFDDPAIPTKYATSAWRLDNLKKTD